MCQEAVAQGFKTLSIPMQEMKAMLANKTLVYQNNPITKWMLANIQLVVDRNGNLMPKKAEDGRANKIDGPATILNALVEFCRNRGSYLPNYESKVSEEGGN
jgi:phage terminase large subunit-like protein